MSAPCSTARSASAARGAPTHTVRPRRAIRSGSSPTSSGGIRPDEAFRSRAAP